MNDIRVIHKAHDIAKSLNLSMTPVGDRLQFANSYDESILIDPAMIALNSEDWLLDNLESLVIL